MANQTNNSDKLSKGDLISFIAILLMGVIVFFGVNFQSLGDKIQSVVISFVLVVLMTVSIFLAGMARGQNRNQSTWKKIEFCMIVLYLATLVPSYFYMSKFFDIQMNRSEIAKQAEDDMGDIKKMFAEYDKLCQSRSYGYETALKAMSMDAQGRARIADILGISVKNVSENAIRQAGESFLNSLRGNDYALLKSEVTSLDNNVASHFKNWNIILVPQYASELGEAKNKFATSLKQIYADNKNKIEQNVPEFNTDEFVHTDNNIADRFSKITSSSVWGIFVTLILGGLGFCKYLLSNKRTVIDFKKGDESVIEEDGGFSY